MAQQRTMTKPTAGRLATPFFMKEFANMGQKNFDTMMGLQKEILDAVYDINQQWILGINAEATLASELFTKLVAARSIPDAVSACQDCGSRQLEILAEQSRGLMAASERIVPRLGNGFKGRRYLRASPALVPGALGPTVNAQSHEKSEGGHGVLALDPALAQETCQSKAIGKDGKPLAGAALKSFMAKCTKDACEPKAVGKNGKPLVGAAKASFIKERSVGGLRRGLGH